MRSAESDLAFRVHDLRNRIAAASSFLQLLAGQDSELRKNEYLMSIADCLESALEASQEISLGMTTPAAGDNLQPVIKRQNVVSAVQVLSVFAPQAYAALNRQFPIDIRYSYILLNEDRNIALNQQEVSSIRENAISNAVAAGATQLKICYQMKEYGLLITIEDDGCGMSEDQINKLLLKRAGDGRVHGLGTKKIINAINDHRSVVTYSSSEGVGTTVKMLCPYENAHKA